MLVKKVVKKVKGYILNFLIYTKNQIRTDDIHLEDGGYYHLTIFVYFFYLRIPFFFIFSFIFLIFPFLN